MLDWLDDQSRYLLHRRVTGRTMTDTFTSATQEGRYPIATFTDNVMTRAARFTAEPTHAHQRKNG